MRKIRLSIFLLLAVLLLPLASPICVQATSGNAAQFTLSSNSYIAATSSTELKTFSALTIEAWIKPDVAREWALIMGKQYNGADSNPWYSYRLCKSNGGTFPDTVNFNIATINTGGEASVTSTTVVQNDTWTHIAGVYDGATIKIYINGNLENTVSVTGVLIESDFPLYTGKAPWTNYNNFNGQMDELRIWNVARTQAQIQDTMNRSLAGNEVGLVAYWPFNDTAGSPTADDASQYNNVGTLYNGAAIVADSTAPINKDFIAQIGMPVSTTIVSNPITVTGISSPVAISITGGEYSISTDGGATWSVYSSTIPGTVSLNNQVKVRQTSSSSYSTLTTATLNIGGINDEFFNVTTTTLDDPNASGLVSWWKAEDNAYDSVSGNHGTPMNGTTYATGQVGQAFSFDGVDDYVKVNASSSLDVGLSTGFSIIAWINPHDISQPQPLIEWNNGSSWGSHLWISVPPNVGGGPGSLFANIRDTSDTDHYFSTTTNVITADTYQHVALTYNKNTGLASLYVNGTVFASQNLGIFVPQTSYDLFIGLRPNIEVSHFDGLIDEVKIFNRVLSAGEVATISSTKPDAFSFTDQTDVAISTVVESNAITVTGMTNPAAISITGGTYSISTDGSTWGSWTSTAGTVSVNNQVKVRQT